MDKRCCPTMQELPQFGTERYSFTRCVSCGNWAGHYKEGVVPLESDHIDMCMQIYLHLGLIKKTGKVVNGEVEYQMTERGKRFKPGIPDV